MQNTETDQTYLDFFVALTEAIEDGEWRACLDSLFKNLRQEFVFDNLAIFSSEVGKLPEVIYARAVGRGRNAEADASWGEEVANQVLLDKTIVQDKPLKKDPENRIKMPYILGLPLHLLRKAGALVFIRFGGPEYTSDQIKLARLTASHVSRILERNLLRESTEQLEVARNYAQLQDDFIATMSHDIHTPLGFIKGYTTSLLRSDTKWDLETQHEFLTIIDEEADHLMYLLDHLLDSARLQSGVLMMDFQPVRLDSLIRDVAMRIRSRNKPVGIELDLQPAPPIQADTVRLVQVFDNLFENSLKYAPDSKIAIKMCKQDKYIRVTFSDHGPGIQPEHLPFLFERFYRVPNQEGKRGTGLGLYICREIVRAHGGLISVETGPDKGTTFIIELPYKQN